MSPTASENLLQDIEQEMTLPTGCNCLELRFVNYVIDLLSFYAIIIGFIFLIALSAYGTKVFHGIGEACPTYQTLYCCMYCMASTCWS